MVSKVKNTDHTNIFTVKFFVYMSSSIFIYSIFKSLKVPLDYSSVVYGSA